MNGPVLTEADIERRAEEARLRSWIRGCVSKVRYATEKRAVRVAKQVQHKRGVQTRAYACDHCQGWHLTKQPKRQEPQS